METKNKIVEMGKICCRIFKVLYCLACVVCLVFIILAITLSCTHTIKSLTTGETAVLFGSLALYAFMVIGLLWNVDNIFIHIVKEQTVACEKVKHYLKKTGIFLILTSTVPAIIGTCIMHLVTPETELNFPVELGGIIAGILLLIFCQFISNGKELEVENK
ncbi:MAG: hypothetical protein NC087_02540 [Anaeroplasma bactoclasticum]|nr:hypothetical protein [Anaeroplasma bactoclasticum]MCM1556394.1 hypothetical protein [Anaeroplasma bactoclasticum]